jgi:hypothetical protein
MVVCCERQEPNIKYTRDIDYLGEGGIHPIFLEETKSKLKKEGKAPNINNTS